MKLRPPFKIHGGKKYLAPWILENFPKDVEDLNMWNLTVGQPVSC